MIALDTFLPAIYQYLVEPGKMSWQTVVPVSYTHLDVYKRQAVSRYDHPYV